MLNRRILRAKAMQAIYAYTQAVESDYQLALDTIADTFVPDLNSMLPQDPKKLEGSRQWATLLFEENYKTKAVSADEEAPVEIKKAANYAISFFHTQCQKDARHQEQSMIADAESIYDYYLLSLWLVTEVADQISVEEDEKRNRILKEAPLSSRALKLTKNQVVESLRKSTTFQDKRIRSGIDKLLDPDLARHLLQELKKDAAYTAYQQLDATTWEQDWQFITEVLKVIIFKSEPAVRFWEQLDSNWSGNEDIVRGMFNKTMQFIKEDPEGFSLQKLSADWDADRDFFQKLYKLCIEKFEEYETLIANKTANWDVERVAQVDKVILVMALAELLNYPSIPVKVSINEYIELSKVYSTPKSKQFVNGILDALAGDLSSQGVLKKSGRGLIDNK
ncbi:transcription antitermination factor NusB [Xanthocytophaga flava]|uniref:transcription antitermination factor NusB n=1 Tax=Xanthocytophaga flava TaxID=3048013 RepID=UPI0028D3D063|nr:transcription antitermination factor NusB [Xanthocytophaga flavus]MDJ1468726.1 transcription antitermination factor NusB [Xanthocytophaga flavus]